MIKLKITLVCLLVLQNSVLAQKENASSNYEIRKAKHIKYCKKIEIVIDPFQNVSSNDDKKITYKIITTHQRKHKTFQYTVSTDSILKPNEINGKQVQVKLSNNLYLSKKKNEIVIHDFFKTALSDSLIISASIIGNKVIKTDASINLFKYKLINENLWVNIPNLLYSNEPKIINTDSNVISVYFKYLPIKHQKKALHVLAINYLLKDTLRFVVDTTSFLQLSYKRDYKLNLFADEGISPTTLNVRFIEVDFSNDYLQENHYQKDDRDRFMVMEDKKINWILKQQEKNEQQEKIKKSIIVMPLSSNLFN